VDNNSDFSLPESDSGKVNLSSNSYAVTNLPYNTTYYWRVMVWDSLDTPSNWTIGPSFNTPLHAFPSIDFEYSPQRPTVGEVVQFTDRSEVYGGSQKSSWTWTFENGDPPTSNSQNPTTTFTSIKGGGNGVSLQVCDNTPPAEGGPYCCSGSKRINVTFPLPRWKEVPPTIWAKKFFASLFQFFDNLF
jgi:hypothetical protein